jgi:phosphoglycerate dehydrogenase-like enzyme
VVDERALAEALEAGRVAGAGLDVFETEPAPLSRLLPRDDVILLPHIGSATLETREAMARAMVDALVRALAAG